MAAEKVTEESIAFIIRYTGGVICIPTTDARLNELELPQMVQNNTDPKKTAFTVTVDYKIGITTGISAHDRALTIRAFTDPNVHASDFNRPGHVFPLRYHPGGVLKRCGHTEAGVDLARLSGLYPAACLSEIMLDDGKMARLPQLIEFSKEHNIKLITIADLIKYRYSRETLIYQPKPDLHAKYHCLNINTEYGEFKCYSFQSVLDNNHHLALVYGDPSKEGTMVRVQHECPLGELVESKECQCHKKTQNALKKICKNGSGVFISLRGVNV